MPHRPTFFLDEVRPDVVAVADDAAPQRIVEIEDDELDLVELADRPVHEFDFGTTRLSGTRPL